MPLAVVATGTVWDLVWTALKVGALSFGGGFVIVPLMQDDAVHVYLQNLNWIMGVDQEKLSNFHYNGVYGNYWDRCWL